MVYLDCLLKEYLDRSVMDSHLGTTSLPTTTDVMKDLVASMHSELKNKASNYVHVLFYVLGTETLKNMVIAMQL